nr:5'-3' exonuclease H3TH domain-containing protein [Pseudenhygromyxa sp. WMMC2535]
MVDANNLVHRLFHASALAFAPSDERTPINATVAWVRQFRALRQRYRPDVVLPVFDGPGPSWRHARFPGYKAEREAPPQALEDQWVWIHRATEALRLPLIREPGVEADDLIAAYTEAAVVQGFEVTVVSNDKDLMQLIRGPAQGSGSVRQLDVFADRRVGPEEVREKFGVGPERLVDLLALTGERGEGIPGVPGIGPKTAAKLLARFGDLEGVLSRAEIITQTKRREALLAHAEDARISRELVALRKELALPLALAEVPPWVPSRKTLDAFFAELGFGRFEEALDPQPEARPWPG